MSTTINIKDKSQWVDGETPLNATNLNAMLNGIRDNANTKMDKLTGGAEELVQITEDGGLKSSGESVESLKDYADSSAQKALNDGKEYTDNAIEDSEAKLIGNSQDSKDSNTIYGAKAYAKDYTDSKISGEHVDEVVREYVHSYLEETPYVDEVFQNVADMINNVSSASTYVKTLGYRIPGDMGGSYYRIKKAEQGETANGLTTLLCPAGETHEENLIAELLWNEKEINIAQIGAYKIVNEQILPDEDKIRAFGNLLTDGIIIHVPKTYPTDKEYPTKFDQVDPTWFDNYPVVTTVLFDDWTLIDGSYRAHYMKDYYVAVPNDDRGRNYEDFNHPHLTFNNLHNCENDPEGEGARKRWCDLMFADGVRIDGSSDHFLQLQANRSPSGGNYSFNFVPRKVGYNGTITIPTPAPAYVDVTVNNKTIVEDQTVKQADTAHTIPIYTSLEDANGFKQINISAPYLMNPFSSPTWCDNSAVMDIVNTTTDSFVSSSYAHYNSSSNNLFFYRIEEHIVGDDESVITLSNDVGAVYDATKEDGAPVDIDDHQIVVYNNVEGKEVNLRGDLLVYVHYIVDPQSALSIVYTLDKTIPSDWDISSCNIDSKQGLSGCNVVGHYTVDNAKRDITVYPPIRWNAYGISNRKKVLNWRIPLTFSLIMINPDWIKGGSNVCYTYGDDQQHSILATTRVSASIVNAGYIIVPEQVQSAWPQGLDDGQHSLSIKKVTFTAGETINVQYFDRDDSTLLSIRDDNRIRFGTNFNTEEDITLNNRGKRTIFSVGVLGKTRTNIDLFQGDISSRSASALVKNTDLVGDYYILPNEEKVNGKTLPVSYRTLSAYYYKDKKKTTLDATIVGGVGKVNMSNVVFPQDQDGVTIYYNYVIKPRKIAISYDGDRGSLTDAMTWRKNEMIMSGYSVMAPKYIRDDGGYMPMGRLHYVSNGSVVYTVTGNEADHKLIVPSSRIILTAKATVYNGHISLNLSEDGTDISSLTQAGDIIEIDYKSSDETEVLEREEIDPEDESHIVYTKYVDIPQDRTVTSATNTTKGHSLKIEDNEIILTDSDDVGDTVAYSYESTKEYIVTSEDKENQYIVYDPTKETIIKAIDISPENPIYLKIEYTDGGSLNFSNSINPPYIDLTGVVKDTQLTYTYTFELTKLLCDTNNTMVTLVFNTDTVRIKNKAVGNGGFILEGDKDWEPATFSTITLYRTSSLSGRWIEIGRTSMGTNWKYIQTMTRLGLASSKFNLGDTFTCTRIDTITENNKTIVVGKDALEWEIIGFDHDVDTELPEGYEHSVTLQLKESLINSKFDSNNNPKYFDPEDESSPSSTIRSYLVSTFPSGLDSSFTSVIGEVTKKTAQSTGASATIVPTSETFFPLSWTEVVGQAHDRPNEGSQYPGIDRSHGVEWWTRTCTSTTNVRVVSVNTEINTRAANTIHIVLPACVIY